MKDSGWEKIRLLFDENERRIQHMSAADPMPNAKWCRESAHRTLGHLTACQASWIALMRQLGDGESKGGVPINPVPLFRKLKFDTTPWSDLLARFETDRAEWRSIMDQIDITRKIETPRRVHSAQTLTRRMVDHEKRHLNDLS